MKPYPATSKRAHYTWLSVVCETVQEASSAAPAAPGAPVAPGSPSDALFLLPSFCPSSLILPSIITLRIRLHALHFTINYYEVLIISTRFFSIAKLLFTQVCFLSTIASLRAPLDSFLYPKNKRTPSTDRCEYQHILTDWEIERRLIISPQEFHYIDIIDRSRHNIRKCETYLL